MDVSLQLRELETYLTERIEVSILVLMDVSLQPRNISSVILYSLVVSILVLMDVSLQLNVTILIYSKLKQFQSLF